MLVTLYREVDVNTTTVRTLRDFIRVQQSVHIRSRNGADAHFLREWNDRARVFLRLFCKEQVEEGEGPDPDNWEDLPDSAVMGPDSLKFFENLREWLRAESDEFRDI